MRLLPIRKVDMRPFVISRSPSDWMDRFFDDVFESSSNGHFHPSVEVTETKKDVVVKAEIPGIDAKDIDLSIDRGILTISGEKKEEKEEEDENCYLKETSYGSFRRSFKLPVDVDEEKIKADFKDGMLKVRLPKAEGKEKKVIKIEAN